ncbi:tetratricopeptide repeat protein [Clostridium tetanomorphum]|uniref:tetratricopeptide repeat protein n=1 Tax=Clostridium tetanomorphum TaxID=1553 RepID=UPI000D84B8AB|nr:tetratricopeptide repeat protein [Clostridium tetanomorphum]SQC03269.1 tetratricopeptide TPR_2 repeat-containing protein [Clostridium tetanomorphum]
MSSLKNSSSMVKFLKEFNYKEFFKKNKIVLLSILAGLIIASSLIFYRISEKNKYSIATNKAEQYFYEADFNKAIEEYNKLYNKDKSSLWKAKIAQVYSVKGDIEISRKYLNDCKLLEDKNAEILNYIVFTEYMNKDFKEALKDGEEAIKNNSKDKGLIKTMFTVYMANNKYEEARKLLLSYPLENKNAYDIAEYGRMLMVIGEKDKAFENLKKAWDIDKDEYKIYDVLVQIAMYDKNQILEDINKLSSKNPEELAYKMWTAKIYSMSPDTVLEAMKIMNSIKDKDLGRIESKVIQAYIYQNSNEIDKEEEIINNLLKDNKNDYRVLHTASWFYLNKKDLVKAEEYCKKSLYKNQDYPDNYGFLMPEILKQKGKSIEGEPYFRTAMLKEPYNYNTMLNIANYYWTTTDNSNKALEYFELAEIVKPNDGEIKYNIALINLTNKKMMRP